MVTLDRTAVRVTSVSKTFGANRALDNVSLTIPKGSSLALVGRNGAGKSTLIAVITGMLIPDTGSVEFDSSDQISGVGCVFQRSTLVNELSAAENIMLNAYPRRLGAVDWRKLETRGREILAEWDCEHISNKIVRSLAPVERKIVEICRALARNPSVLLLDEPTAGLDYAGAQRLFARIREAQQRGVSVLYVSHHMEEIFDICDSTTVLRDGRVVLDRQLDGMSIRDLVEAMVGDPKAVRGPVAPRPVSEGAARVLKVKSLSVEGRVVDVDLEVRKGECIGLAGLDGAGHMQVAQALCGLVPADAQEVKIDDRPLRRFKVAESIKLGIGFIPEDRHDGGYVPALSISENATLPIMRKLCGKLGIVSGKAREQKYGELGGEWSIKADGPNQPVEELSGGNQQKVVLARAMSTKPSTIILMNPTAGVDIAAKQSIYETISASAENGKAVVIASTDDDDFAICHRVLVMVRGKLHCELKSPFTGHDLAMAIQGA
jgi:simple sugar transport system ATP-binding protein